MTTLRALLANAKVRLALRALVAGIGVVIAKYVGGNHDVQALEVAGFLAFCEIFTPLNSAVGWLKLAAAPIAPAPPSTPPPVKPAKPVKT